MWNSTNAVVYVVYSSPRFINELCQRSNDRRQGRKDVKVAQELISLYDEYSSYLASHSAEPFQPANPLVRVIDSRVVVDAVASGEVNVLKADLVSLGMQRAVAFGRIVSGELPISAIPAMSALPTLNFARAASGFRQGGGDFSSPGMPGR